MARIRGSAGNDLIDDVYPAAHHATEGRDVIFGLGGDDNIFASGGNDSVDGGSGNDILYGSGGNDWLAGQSGDDAIFGDNPAYGDPWNIDPIGGNDKLYGGAGNDYLDGQGGNDRLSGAAGNDTLIDRFGVNRAFGGAGDDYLHVTGLADGGAGNDGLQQEAGWGQQINTTLHGGAGADVFQVWLDASSDPNAPRVTISIDDFRPEEGDRLSIGAQIANPDGSIVHVYGSDFRALFDSNGSGATGDGDQWAPSDGKGGEDHLLWNLTLHVNTPLADWMLI